MTENGSAPRRSSGLGQGTAIQLDAELCGAGAAAYSNDAEAALTAQARERVAKNRELFSCSHEDGASSDGRRGRRYQSGLDGGALMKISKKAIEVFLVAAAMLCTLPVHGKVSKPKQLQVTYYYLPG